MPKEALSLMLAEPIPERMTVARKPAAVPEDDQADELGKLFPSDVVVTVQRFTGRDDKGRKQREAMTVYVEAATIEELAAIARPLMKLANSTDQGIDVGTLIAQHKDEVIAAVSAGTGVPVDVLKNLKLADLTALGEAVFQVNADFFVHRLPLIAAKIEGIFGRVLGAGRTSSPTSTPPVSPTPAA